MIIGINASNVKSVGGVNHIYNLILNLRKDEKKKHSIKKNYNLGIFAKLRSSF